LVLVLRFLADFGYMNSRDVLAAESGVNLDEVRVEQRHAAVAMLTEGVFSQWDAADNVDLMLVMTEYEKYFEEKYSRKIKFFRKKNELDEPDPTAKKEGAKKPEKEKKVSPWTVSREPPCQHRPFCFLQDPKTSKRSSDPAATARKPPKGKEKPGGLGPDHLSAQGVHTLGMEGAVTGTRTGNSSSSKRTILECGGSALGAGLPQAGAADTGKGKLLPDYNGNEELGELAGQIARDILVEKPEVGFSDIASLEPTKRLLKEAVVMPARFPALFTGLLAPWRGLLLFGPPGTGKTMLAKAVASECNTTFFNISASSVVSKYHGESEKLIRVLFEVARTRAPSTVFFDELDSIMMGRGGGGEHEASRRMKTELLIQMDGLANRNTSASMVFVLAASNTPWDLDHAVLRRFEKRIMVPVPDIETRYAILCMHLGTPVEAKTPPPKPSRNAGRARGKTGTSARQAQASTEAKKVDPNGLDLQRLAELTEGYSGADIVLLAKEAAMRPVRRLMDTLDMDAGARPVSTAGLRLDAIRPTDVEEALRAVKPSASIHREKYASWQAAFGATSSGAG